MRSSKRYLALVVLATSGIVAAFVVRTRTADSARTPRDTAGESNEAPIADEKRAPSPAPTSAPETPPDATPPVPGKPLAATAPKPSEAALMARLRHLSGTDPELSLRLAREGNRQLKDGPEEAERRWYVVRSLMDLGRRDEARAEARALIDKYPASDWAQDVHRHLFVNPPTSPAERGHGKTLELE
jgi:hypothetical protein